MWIAGITYKMQSGKRKLTTVRDCVDSAAALAQAQVGIASGVGAASVVASKLLPGNSVRFVEYLFKFFHQRHTVSLRRIGMLKHPQ